MPAERRALPERLAGANWSRSPHFRKASLPLYITERDLLEADIWIVAEFFLESAKGCFVRFETINLRSGKDASQLRGGLSFIRADVEAETRPVRRKCPDIDERIFAERRRARNIAPKRSEGAPKESLCVVKEIHALQSPMTVTIIFRRCAACRCSNRKMPCQVPNCIRESATGITSLERVNTIRM